MGTSADKALAAERFVDEWRNKGQEDEHTETFWNQFLQEVMSIDRVHHVIDYQKKVKIGRNTKKIDGYIPTSKVLIEQKSHGIDLRKTAKQSDGQELTPYEQGLRYATYLPTSEAPDFIITSNFQEFLIYDRRCDPNGENPIEVLLEELPRQSQVFNFIVDPVNQKISRQQQVNLDAARLIGEVYERISARYHNPDASRHDLAVLMVRILFCLYAEDSGLFERSLFYNYLKEIPAGEGVFRDALIKLFRVLNTPVAERDAYLGEMLSQFPYVNGSLFADDIEIPIVTNDIKFQLLQKAGAEFNWSEISPVIFGSIFESILSGDERRAGGMHYTSVENIHKVIDPLFLDDLRLEFQRAGNHKAKLRELQDKIAALNFLDPACGSGNFLTQTYLELRALENDIIARLIGDQMAMELEDEGFPSFVKVNVGQFYGIEINDFAVSVANTALWIADHQANQQTAKLINRPVVNLPLKDYRNIVCSNALRIDWNDVLPAEKCIYVMGNPPFYGHQWRNSEQQEDMKTAFFDLPQHGKLDYVCAWYAKTSHYFSSSAQAAFVSTNSICQGESVSILWKYLFGKGIQISFAHRSFIWNSEATDMAHVHVVVIGFSHTSNKSVASKTIYTSTGKIHARNINGYLVDAPNAFIENRNKPINLNAPEMTKGSQPTDGGFLVLTPDERSELVTKYPTLDKVIRPYLGGREFINNQERYCLWFVNEDISQYAFPEIRERLNNVRETRLKSPTASVRKDAEKPWLFTQIRQPLTAYLAVPEVSSERRRFIPVGYVDSTIIASNQLRFIPTDSLFMFGLLVSTFHMAWVRVIAGRLEMRYRYSPAIYNSFVFPDATRQQITAIEECAQRILDIRKRYPNNSLADMYDPDNEFCFPDLITAHKNLDRVVEQTYGVNFKGDEERIVTHLFDLYAQVYRV